MKFYVIDNDEMKLVQVHSRKPTLHAESITVIENKGMLETFTGGQLSTLLSNLTGEKKRNFNYKSKAVDAVYEALEAKPVTEGEASRTVAEKDKYGFRVGTKISNALTDLMAGNMALKEIYEKHGVRTTLDRALKKMEKKGWVIERKDDGHLKSCKLEATNE